MRNKESTLPGLTKTVSTNVWPLLLTRGWHLCLLLGEPTVIVVLCPGLDNVYVKSFEVENFHR